MLRFFASCLKWVAFLGLTISTLSVFAEEEPSYPLDISFQGEYAIFLVKAYEQFRLDQEGSSLDNFDIWMVDENEGQVLIVFTPHLTPEDKANRIEVEQKAKENGMDAVFIRHHPKNRFGESISYRFSKDTQRLLRKEPSRFERQ